jgi:hypothetical protein
MENAELVATAVMIRQGDVVLELLNGSTHTFPVCFYPRLAGATPEQLADVHLRVGGRALRWDGLDEDIWVTDAVLGRYPNGSIALAS